MPEALAAEAVGALLFEEAAMLGVGELVGSSVGAGVLGAGEAGLAAGFDLLGGETAINAAASAAPLAGGAELAGPAGLFANSATRGETPIDFNRAIGGVVEEGAALGVGDFIGNAGLLAAPVATAGGAGAFAMPSISQLGSGLSIATSLYGMTQADQMKKLAMLQANKASPWQSAGGADLASQQLMALISGKTDVSTLPGYKAGSQAVERRMAAQGFNGSGNMMAALQEYGGKFYNDAVAQLAGLAGTQFNPATSGTLAMGGFNNAAATNLAAMSNINKTLETQPAWR